MEAGTCVLGTGRNGIQTDLVVLPVVCRAHLTGFSLTVRQVEILRFMADGEAIDGIAEELGYSSSTIKKEVHNTLQRVGARNRTHAVAMAIRAGLI